MKNNHNNEFSLDHVGLAVPDLDEAERFFIENFGARTVFHLPPFSDPTGDAPARLGAPRNAAFSLTMLELGGGHIELLQWDPTIAPSISNETPPMLPPNVTHSPHLAVSVSNITEALKQLQAVDGVRVLSGPVTFEQGPTPGLTNAFITTPWGLLIELMSWPD